MSNASRPAAEADTKVRLSAILPNYNHARYLPRAIAAITAQLGPEDELIVIDDASLDDSVAVIAKLAEGDRRIVPMQNAVNQGALVTLQRGLDAASGRFVYFAAADDEILPGFFKAALMVLEANAACGLFCADAILRDGESGLVTGHRPVVRPRARGGFVAPAAAREMFRKADNFILTGSSVFRRTALVEKGGFDARNGSFADGLLARKVAMGHGFHYEPRAAAVWNIFADGLSRSTALDVAKAERALREIPARLAQDTDFPSWYPALFERRWRFGAARLAIAADPPDRDLLMAMAARTRLDSTVLGLLARIDWLPGGRLPALVWISLRLRPFRFRDVLRTALARKLEAVTRRRPRADK